MDDLIAYLNARTDEDARAVAQATVGPWKWIDPGGKVKQALTGPDIPGGGRVLDVAHADSLPSFHDAYHIATWHPQRILGLLTALRAILVDYSHEAGETRTLLELAAALYGHRDDYRQEWRP